MDLKKSNRASLENKRSTNFFIGLIISCSLILISFEWTRPLDHNPHLALANNIEIDIEIMEVIPREESQPDHREELPAIEKILDIVPDDVELEEVIFGWEVTKDTEYDFVNTYTDETEEVISNNSLESMPTPRTASDGTSIELVPIASKHVLAAPTLSSKIYPCV